MKEILLSIGTVCTIPVDPANEANFMIIGNRQYNPYAGRAYDYAAVPISHGLDVDGRSITPFSKNNIFYFNHTDIIRIMEDKEWK